MSRARDLSRVTVDGADIIPFNPAASYSPGTIGHTISAVIGRAPIDPRSYTETAIDTGAADATAAFALAIAESKATGRPISAPGVYRIDGTLDPKGATFQYDAQQYGRENTTVADWGMVIQHNSVSGPLFAPTGGGFSFDGVVFYDPLQPGGAPVARPPVIDIASPYHAVDVTIQNCAIVNAYDFIHSAAGSTCGDWRICNNRGYAIRYVYDFAGAVPEVIFAESNIWSWGVWQAGAAVDSFALAKWTALNGAYLRWDTGGTSVDGFKSSNEIIFGYKNVLCGISGLLNVSTISNISMDQCIQPIYTEGDAGIVATLSGKSYATAYGNDATNLNAIKLGGSGNYKLNIDLQGQYAAGSWLDMVTAGTGYVVIRGTFANWGKATGATNVNLANIQAGAIMFSFRPELVNAWTTDQVGLNVVDIRVMHSETIFRGLARALDIGTCPSADAKGIRDASLVVNTVSSNSYTNSAGSKFTAAGTYDKP